MVKFSIYSNRCFRNERIQVKYNLELEVSVGAGEAPGFTLEMDYAHD